METVLLYSTWPDAESAQACAEALVEQRKAACATTLPGAVSFFRWNDKIENAAEVLLFVKTSTARAAEARDEIIARHPYELPCVTAFRIDNDLSNAQFLAWLTAETS
jgi:periplasmic divalent cation tolerance protein